MESARGTDYRGGRMYVPTTHFCVRDATSHTKLKYRQAGQGTEEELLDRDLVSELIERESQASEKEASRKRVGLVIPDIKAIGAPKPEEKSGINLDADDSDLESSSDEDDDENREKPSEKAINLKGVKREFTEMNKNEEDEKEEEEDDDDDDDDSDDDDSDEETAELLAELEKIKKERAEEQARAKAAAEAKSEEEKDMAALVGNPLMANDSAEYGSGVGEVRDSFTVEQKWYEDSVFKNQSRGEPDNKKKRFINDTVRNQFHLQFLKKYIT